MAACATWRRATSGLCVEALRERSAILANAPHVAQRLPLIVPSYEWWRTGFYGAGLIAYDALAGRRGLGSTELLGAPRTRELLPGVQARGLSGGVRYWDGQFDDARLAVLLARTAASRGALLVNHCAANGLLREAGQVRGVRVHDREGGGQFDIEARCVVNATGVWVDALRDLDRDEGAPVRPPMVAPSQGVHLVVDRRFLPGSHGLMVPRTADGRVLFALPWLGKTVLGTTDTPRGDLAAEPMPFAHEVDFILREAAKVLATPPGRDDVRSIWVGLRPLVKPPADDGGDTKALSREHTVLVSRSGLVTVTGTARRPRHAAAPAQAVASAAVMAGSRRVQSARSSMHLFRAKSASTLGIGQRGALVVLAGHAPGGGEVDEHRLAGRAAVHLAGAQGCQRSAEPAPAWNRQISRSVGTIPRSTAAACYQQQASSAETRRARPQREATQRPGHEGQRHQQRQQGAGAVDAGLLAQHPDQPDHGGEHREGHQRRKCQHPGARAGQRARQRRPPLAAR
jgi:hypothetical protein